LNTVNPFVSARNPVNYWGAFNMRGIIHLCIQLRERIDNR
jgi:hypothetical protein